MCKWTRGVNVKKLDNMGVEYNINLNEINKEEIKDLGRNIIKNNLVLVRNQNLTAERLVEICRTIGDTDKRPKNQFKYKDFDDITMVTNRRNEKGEKIGFFATEELGWHSNGNTRSLDDINESCVVFCIVKPGIDSVTSYVDTQQSYNDLPTHIRDEVDQLESWMEFKNNTFYHFEETDKELPAFEGGKRHNGSWKPLAIKHHPKMLPENCESDYVGLYFAHHFIRKFRNIETKEEYSLEDKKELWDFLMNHVYQEKYMYHHHWKEGDIIFNDQFLSFHKRNKPEGDRLLFRVGMNYNKLGYL